MFFIFCILVLLIISIAWAYLSVIKERQRHEIEKAKEDMSTGRVIFHSSSGSESDSSL